MTRLLAVGLGYSARAVAERLAGKGWQIAGTSRSEDGLAAIRARGYEAVPFREDAPSLAFAAALREANHLLISAPPSRGEEAPAAGHADDPVLSLPDIADLATPNLRWIGYLSTIGVYGDHGGGWVDEATPPAPLSPRTMKRVIAEREWRSFGDARRAPVAILRLSGIYGPGRNTLVKLKAGTERRIYKPDQVFNRIHVADIAAAVTAAIARSADGVFNVTDDEPAPPQDVIAYGAELLGVEPPPLLAWDDVEMSPMARSFWLDNKRVRNEAMKAALGVTPLYPSYREGLRALLAAG